MILLNFSLSYRLFITQCSQSIVGLVKNVSRLGGNGKVASVPLNNFWRKQRRKKRGSSSIFKTKVFEVYN